MPVHYVESDPPAQLRPFILTFWEMKTDSSDASSGTNVALPPILPDSCSDLIFNLGARYRSGISKNPTNSPPTGVFLTLPMATPLHLVLCPDIHCTGIRFRPGMLAAISRHNLLINEQVTLLDGKALRFADESAITDRLLHCKTTDNRFTFLQKIAQELIHKTETELTTVCRLRHILHNTHKSPTLTESQIGCSERQWQRLMKRHFGLTPKQFERISRFRRTLAAVLRRDVDHWTDAAHAFGYYDQAHMNRDFRQFSGQTPTELIHSLSDVGFLQSAPEDLPYL